MFVKSDIRKVAIAVEKAFYHEVYLELGRAGFIHLSPLEAGETNSVMDENLKKRQNKHNEILSGLHFILNSLDIEPEEAKVFEKIRDTKQDEEFISKTKKSIDRLQRLRSKVEEELEVITKRMEYLDVLHQMGIDPRTIQRMRLLQLAFGTVENTEWEVPVEETYTVAKAGRYVLGVALSGSSHQMLELFYGYGFTDKTKELIGVFPGSTITRKNSLIHRLEILDGYLMMLKNERGNSLMSLYSIYRGYDDVLNALKMSTFSDKAMFITGWMERTEKKNLVSMLQKICGDRFIVAVSEQRDPDAPVRLRNISLLRPFELLVKTMGIPSNQEIDPTPLTAVTFVLMFGLMFGDLGQGLVLALAGFLLKHLAKKKGVSQAVPGQAGAILIICGLFAAICGVFYGSIFSNEHIIPALWFHPIEHPMDLFFVTILMGAVFIMMGLCLNIINSLMNSKYTQAFLEKRGIAILVLYAAIIVLAVRYTHTGQSPTLWQVGVFIMLPLVFFTLRGVIGPLLFQDPKPKSMSEYAIETLVEILEIGLSMLANTISFIRVGAFALSHAGLSIVTYTLAGIVDPSMKSVGAVAIIIIGNIFIIGFEGLVCGIQALRLEYYEFFNKFFTGDGVAFTPFTLKVKTSEV